MTPSRRLFLASAAALAAALAAPAAAHRERQIASPIRPGPVPDPARVNPTALVVCKASSRPTREDLIDIRQRLRTSSGAALAAARADLAAWRRNRKLYRRCRYEHVQDAVNAAGDGTDIKVLPGVYREEPSRAAPTSEGCNPVEEPLCTPNGAYSFEYHLAHPNDANLVAILGKRNITLEGTGARPADVVIDAGFAKDVVVRADRADGFIARNLWARDANEHGIYVVETDGYVFDRTIGSFSKEYQLFSFASDNGLFQDCEALGGGDSGIYTGATPDTHTEGRFAAEIRRCVSRHNALGFSGTNGSSVWIHDSVFTDNGIGISFDTDSDATAHAGPPQRRSLIENNLIHGNNFDVYAATSDVPVRGPGYSFFRYPIGSAMWIIGGEDNVIRDNFIYDNSRFGMLLAGNPLETPVPAEIHRNQVYGNLVGVAPDGTPAPNLTAFPPGGNFPEGGSDFFWDGTGNDNCWGPQDPASGPVKVGPDPIPGPCPFPNTGLAGLPRTDVFLLLLSCLLQPIPGTMPTEYKTADAIYPCPWGQTNDAPYRSSAEAECGNGLIDPLDKDGLKGGGEDCDPGGYAIGGVVPDTCESLGQGPGALACRTDCTYETSACAAPSCARFGLARLRATSLGAPAGDEDLDFFGDGLSGAGRSFDPLTEEVSFALRDDEGGVHAATLPAGAAWSVNGAGTRYLYNDPAGTYGGLVQVDLRAAPSFATTFRALVKLRDANLAAAAGSRTATAVLRIGDDCWSKPVPCLTRASGRTLACRGR
jgi:hypothetical protein